MTLLPAEPSTSLEPYKTSDTPYAAYLLYSGQKLVGSIQDPNDYKREVLVFVYTDVIEELEQEWRSGQAIGKLRDFHRYLKEVNRFIKKARTKRGEE